MQRLWAPWRMTYVGEIDAEKKEGCFFCNAWLEVGRERENLVLARGRDCFVMLNRYPYTNGHLMVAPARHAGSMEDVTLDEGTEIWRLATMSKIVLSKAFNTDGFNVGINQGRVGGAGVVDHLHAHLVPRWSGDVNFMPVMADVRIISQALEDTWQRLKPFFDELAG